MASLSESSPSHAPGGSMDEASRPACVVCFEPISYQSKAVIKNCGHEFCFTCIKSWMQNTATCPLCKQNFTGLRHSFTSDGSYEEEAVEPPNISPGGGGGGGTVEEQLQCLDHAYFIAEVQRLLTDAERIHRNLYLERQTNRRLALWEEQRLAMMEGVVAELRTHKRKLQALLQFEPHVVLQDLYRLQDLVRSSYGAPVVSQARARSPVRYSADDAESIDDDEDDELAEDMARISFAKSKQSHKQEAQPRRQRKNKTRTPASQIGARNKRGIAN